MNNIEAKAFKFTTQNNLLEEINKVYVATSGGADSMALLAFMDEHKEYFEIEVGAVHINHGIRGETADRDEAFVREYCNKHDIEFISFNANLDNVEVPENASEEWARQLRYNYFSTLTKRGVVVATAHTLSDQTETVLFRLARGGSGLRGLSGIPVKRDGYIRPFLCLNRSEIEELVEHYGTGNITDETNLGDDYSRNKIRHHVIPVLKEINGNTEDSFGKFCDRMEKAQRYIEKQARIVMLDSEEIECVKYRVSGLVGLDEIVLDEALLQLLGKINSQSEKNVEMLKRYLSIVTNGYTSEELVGELQVSKTVSIAVTTKYITIKDTSKNEMGKCLVGSNTFGLYNYNVEVEELDQEGYKYNCKDKFDLCNYADTEKLDLSKCKLRGRAEGDVFKPACKTGGKLTKFMRNIPLAERESVPVLEYNGQIVWIWGVGFTDGFTPTEESENILKFTWN